MGNYGIKVSKAGYNVLTTGLENQVFNSSANSLKIWMAGSTNISVTEANGGAGTGSVNVAHNLSYAPFYLCYFKLDDANKLWLQGSLDDGQLLTTYINTSAWSNSTNLHGDIVVNGTLAAFTAVMYYLVFIDEAYV